MYVYIKPTYAYTRRRARLEKTTVAQQARNYSPLPEPDDSLRGSTFEFYILKVKHFFCLYEIKKDYFNTVSNSIGLQERSAARIKYVSMEKTLVTHGHKNVSYM
jgi:hypothetical protein